MMAPDDEGTVAAMTCTLAGGGDVTFDVTDDPAVEQDLMLQELVIEAIGK